GEGADERHHRLQARPEGRREVGAGAPAEDSRDEEELEDEELVAERVLPGDALGEALRLDLVGQDGGRLGAPAAAGIEVRPVGGPDEDAGRLADQVVVRGRATGVLAADLPQM